MRFKPFYLYVAGAIIALVFCVYELVVYHASLSITDILLSISPVIILAYLAFKVHREADDEDLM